MDDFATRTMEDLAKRHQEQIERAYHIGILHGINAQSMAQAKNSVMTFEDYGWKPEDSEVAETVSDTAENENETNDTHDNE